MNNFQCVFLIGVFTQPFASSYLIIFLYNNRSIKIEFSIYFVQFCSVFPFSFEFIQKWIYFFVVQNVLASFSLDCDIFCSEKEKKPTTTVLYILNTQYTNIEYQHNVIADLFDNHLENNFEIKIILS